MRLKVSATSANEQLVALVNDGYVILQWLREDHAARRQANAFDDTKDNAPYESRAEEWAGTVVDALRSIFPTDLEVNTFLNPEIPLGAVSGDYNWASLVRRLQYFIRGLDQIRQRSLPEYTDIPLQPRLYVEDIDSFRKVRDINPAAVEDVLKGGYLDQSEDSIQMALEQILNVPMHKKDWGGEVNDLYTANLILNGARTETAFLLKGNGLRRKMMEISDCGANGDQLVRLFRSPAKLFVVQFVGNVGENVIADLEMKVQAFRSQRRDACYCVMDGQDTARLLRAYGKI
jgi:hypothetical protein